MELFEGEKTTRFEQTGGRRRRPFTAVLPLSASLGADERLLMKGKWSNHVLTGMRVFLTSLIQTNASHKTSLNTRPVSSLLSFTKGDDWFWLRDIWVKPTIGNTLTELWCCFSEASSKTRAVWDKA